MTAGQIKRAIGRLYRDISEALPKGKNTIALVGIRTRGETLARRLFDKLKEESGILEKAMASARDIAMEEQLLDWILERATVEDVSKSFDEVVNAKRT